MLNMTYEGHCPSLNECLHDQRCRHGGFPQVACHASRTVVAWRNKSWTRICMWQNEYCFDWCNKTQNLCQLSPASFCAYFFINIIMHNLACRLIPWHWRAIRTDAEQQCQTSGPADWPSLLLRSQTQPDNYCTRAPAVNVPKYIRM